jgi:branched-chain amino acid transport system permease protein
VSLTAVVRLGALLAAVACGIALPYVVGTFLLGTATLTLVYGLFALSVNLLAGYGGLLSLGHAGIMATAAYGTGYVATHSHGGHLEQVIVGLLAALAASAVFGLMAMRTRAVYFLMVTLAQGMIVFGLASSLAPITGAENGLTGVARPGWVAQDWQYYYLCLAVLLVCAGMMWVVVRSPFGLALRGLRESRSRLRMLGYNPTLHTFYGFVVSGFFAGVAGVLFAYNNQFVSPSVAEFATSAQGILMVLVGGIGTLSGPVVGAFIIVLAQNWLSLHTDRWLTVQGVVFVLMVLFAREGLVGALARAWGAVMERRAGGAAPTPGRPAVTRPAADAEVSRHRGKVT